MNELASIKPYGSKWILTQDVTFYHTDDHKGDKTFIKKGFIFDGCSIPICFFGQHIEPHTLTACMIHDYLWTTKKYGFFKSNLLFARAMRQRGVPVSKKIRYWLGVTLFGWVIYYFLK